MSSAQPPPSSLSLRSLVSLPYRLCNPPPAVGKVRSCAITPILDVRLEDVLARRHVPPIGLKDFEEYLLYVEHSPENLYFVLWLKDYATRYHTWVQREKSYLKQRRHQKFAPPPTPDPSLAMFYLRAKQTFFTPNGEYELNIPSDVLAPFHVPSSDHGRTSLWHTQSIHPDPAVFSEVALEARSMLNESLKRFVRAAYTNVGSQRALCGIIAGCVFIIVSGLLPLILTTGRWNDGPHSRFVRFAAFPGLWFGLTVLIASLQGVCIMIYVFGDLRQLRKFELARPTISRPIPIPDVSLMPPMSTPGGLPLFVPSRSVPVPEKAGCPSNGPPMGFVPPSRPYTRSSTSLITDASSDRSSIEGCSGIDVSPAFFDDIPAPEGPATASCLHRPEYRLPPPIAHVEPAQLRMARSAATMTAATVIPEEPGVVMRHRKRSEYGPTAGFIPSDYPSTGSTTSLAETARSLRSKRSACYFDFDSLPGGPVVATHMLPTSSAVGADPSSPHPSALSTSPSLTGPSGLLAGRAQYRCASCPTTTIFTSTFSDDGESLAWDRDSKPSRPRPRSSIRRIQWRWEWWTMWLPSFTAGVPAFAAPLTAVQSPVVKRAQWEVVIRAGVFATVLAGGLTGIAVSVVP